VAEVKLQRAAVVPDGQRGRAKRAPVPGASTLRLDADIRDRVDVYAKRTRRSRNATVNYLAEVALNFEAAAAADELSASPA